VDSNRGPQTEAKYQRDSLQIRMCVDSTRDLIAGISMCLYNIILAFLSPPVSGPAYVSPKSERNKSRQCAATFGSDGRSSRFVPSACVASISFGVQLSEVDRPAPVGRDAWWLQLGGKKRIFTTRNFGETRNNCGEIMMTEVSRPT
jgi:hypothetical protein